MINPARIDFVTLRLFCAVAETGSLTRGAARCNLALSAASRRIADFEAAARAALLERGPQGVRLPAAGHIALQHALRLFQGFELFGNELDEYANGSRGHIRLWANMSALVEFLPAALSRFLAGYPDTHVEVEEQLSGDIVRALIDGIADVGVFVGGAPADGLDVRPFQTDQLVLLVSASHPVARRRAIAFEECLDYDFVGLNRGSSLLNTIRAAAQQAGRALRLRVQVRSFDAMAEMIANNLGIGVLPAGACAHRLQPGRLKAVRLTDAWARRELVLATNPERPLTRAAGLLVDHLLAQAPRAA